MAEIPAPSSSSSYHTQACPQRAPLAPQNPKTQHEKNPKTRPSLLHSTCSWSHRQDLQTRPTVKFAEYVRVLWGIRKMGVPLWLAIAVNSPFVECALNL
ncbi:hypothetical protein AMTR_s00045p00146910 [Amborella trichopoda]|uniref:Uncharacterized protein n=1 Tax=Amborella trichopoda TaxID=13333 RepID=W1P2D4_AMBTC|nr:hypothetical protein AMTR_s00045p00146910 [Amborella trichopoda]